MPVIQNSTRAIDKATYVPLIPPAITKDTDLGKAIIKFGYVQQLSLYKGEVDLVLSTMGQALTTFGDLGNNADVSKLVKNTSLWDTLKLFEGTPLPSLLPSPSIFAEIPSSSLIVFGNAVLKLRKQALDQKQIQVPKSTSDGPITTLSPANLTILVNAAVTAVTGFEGNVNASAIGMLHLERLEMTPAGIERGELIATIPLAPKERTSVVQKEWSVTKQEFTSIVTDSLENYSETGVTEKTDLAQSTDSQTQHSNQFNINSTVQGSYGGFVTATVATNYSSTDQKTVGLKESRDHSVETTKKASSRVKQEHKTTISTMTVTGSSETTTRTLENPSAKDPMRIDYFSMMRKWHVGLYRYGLRMTYDILIPEPGAAMREIYATLDELQSQVSQLFVFKNPDTGNPMTYADISTASYETLQKWASTYNAQLPPSLTPGPPFQAGGVIANLPIGHQDWWYWYSIQVPVPDGHQITDVSMNYRIGWDAGTHPDNRNQYVFAIEGANYEVSPNEVVGGIFGTQDNLPSISVDLTKITNFMYHYTGQQTINCLFRAANPAFVQFTISVEPTPATIDQWVSSVWSALYGAAQNAYYAQQQSINTQISALQDQINNVDTLTLRREENDEIMKGVLQWLLGPTWDFMPPDVIALLNQSGDPTHGCRRPLDKAAPNELGITSNDWTTVVRYQNMVKFINEAIDWDNVLYFLYSYFWDIPVSWDFIRGIRHPDATRQAFLRSGSARVVLTVRNGYETAVTCFVEQGLLPGETRTTNDGMIVKCSDLTDDPYMNIAQEIYDYDNATYPGIPPANPGGPALDQLTLAACSAKVHASPPVSIPVVKSTGFLIGSSVVIDTVGSGLQEIQVITSIPNNSHITVKQLRNSHDGTVIAFPVTSLDQSVTTTCSVKVPASPPVNIPVDDSSGFVVGDYAVIDTIDSPNGQEVQPITAVPDVKHVQVKQLNKDHDGSVNKFPVTQMGQKGVLIYEWFEYTPTSGTDIAVTSDITTIA